jgi:hypothetical protein
MRGFNFVSCGTIILRMWEMWSMLFLWVWCWVESGLVGGHGVGFLGRGGVGMNKPLVKIENMYSEEQIKIFLAVLESIVRSGNYGTFLLGDYETEIEIKDCRKIE